MKSVKFNQQFSFNSAKTISKTATVTICFILGGFLASCTSLPTSPAPEQAVSHTEAEQTETQLSANHIDDYPIPVGASVFVGKLGVVVDPSMTIVSLSFGSPAEREGIEVGDTLVSFDGIPYATQYEKIGNLLLRESVLDEKTHDIIVLREGVVKQFNMHMRFSDKPNPPPPTPTSIPLDSNLLFY